MAYVVAVAVLLLLTVSALFLARIQKLKDIIRQGWELQVRPLTRDARRLDWMEGSRVHIAPGGRYFYANIYDSNGNLFTLAIGDTVREVLDAAIKASEGQDVW
jgi:hypothetical protein